MNWRKVEVQNSESQIKTLVGDVRSAANKSMEALWRWGTRTCCGPQRGPCCSW